MKLQSVTTVHTLLGGARCCWTDFAGPVWGDPLAPSVHQTRLSGWLLPFHWWRVLSHSVVPLALLYLKNLNNMKKQWNLCTL